MKLNNRLLKAVFEIQNPSENKRCNDHAMKVITSLAPKGCTIVRKSGNLLIRKGGPTGPHPYFLAHMDQVHNYEPFMQLRLHDGVLSALDGNDKQCGVGGDDKCGIYLALAMLHELDHCTAVFVRDEEIGCLGSGSVPLTWFDHAAFVVQSDRNNRTFDVIRDTNGMTCASDEFIAAVLALPQASRHSENTGSITDIGELACRGLEVSMINISSGYHDPHTSKEVVVLDELLISCELALAIARTMGDYKWSHKPTSSWHNYYSKDYKWIPYSKSDDWSIDPPLAKHDADYGGYRETLYRQLEENGLCREFDMLDKWTLEDLENELLYIEMNAELVEQEESLAAH
jgi:hypothetical protein